ncbi:MAG: hypothetical protein AAF514_10175 [Verrucomicrobiota bacterium]
MSPKKHGQLLLYSFVTWLTFYLIGLPDYYQRWPFWAKLTIVILVTFLYFPATAYTLKRFWQDRRYVRNSLWLALYLTLPLFIYDYILLAVFWGLGIGFVFPFWYLSFFYFSFWIQFPLVGWWMEQGSKGSE